MAKHINAGSFVNLSITDIHCYTISSEIYGSSCSLYNQPTMLLPQLYRF